MSATRQNSPSLFSQVDVSTSFQPHASSASRDDPAELLREILTAQDRTNDLLEELVNTLGASHKQRLTELKHWRHAHPSLAAACREAAESLSRVQIEYLDRITEEINETSDDMLEGEFALNEFIDRNGPRLAQLNGMIQVLAQLSSGSDPAASEQ